MWFLSQHFAALRPQFINSACIATLSKKFFQKIYADKTLKLTKAGFQKPANMGDVELDCSAYDAANELEISDHTFEAEY